MGGTLAAIERGWIQQQVQEAAYRAQLAIDRGEAVVVGVNRFVEASADDRRGPAGQALHSALRARSRVPSGVSRRVRAVRATRSRDCQAALDAVSAAALDGGNLVPPILAGSRGVRDAWRDRRCDAPCVRRARRTAFRADASRRCSPPRRRAHRGLRREWPLRARGPRRGLHDRARRDARAGGRIRERQDRDRAPRSCAFCVPRGIQAGRIVFEDRDLLALDEAAMRSVRGGGIGFVFQEPAAALSPVFTIGDQIAEAIVAHGGAGWHEARRLAIGPSRGGA